MLKALTLSTDVEDSEDKTIEEALVVIAEEEIHVLVAVADALALLHPAHFQVVFALFGILLIFKQHVAP